MAFGTIHNYLIYCAFAFCTLPDLQKMKKTILLVALAMALIAAASGCVNSTYLIPVELKSQENYIPTTIPNGVTAIQVLQPPQILARNNFSSIIFYYPEPNQDYFLDIIHSIPAEYVEGLREIRITRKTMFKCQQEGGQFIPTNTIEVCSEPIGIFKDSIYHEVAHFSLYRENVYRYCNQEHKDCFIERLVEILR